VESAPDGGRRRVLRPWGMRRTAPPTISPDMPDLAEAGIPTRGTRLDPAVRFDFWIVGGLVVVLVAVALVNGATRSSRNAAHDANAQVAAGSAAYVSATTPAIVQEARLKAPPLVDVSPAATATPPVTHRVTTVAPLPARGPADRWQPLRSALAQCGSVNGAIGRAMCQQEARLAHCEGFWGLVADCPTTRSEYGQ